MITATQYEYDRFQANDTRAHSVSRQTARVSQALVSLMWTDENLICSSFIIITVKLRRVYWSFNSKANDFHTNTRTAAPTNEKLTIAGSRLQ